jgi:hypothetical protein
MLKNKTQDQYFVRITNFKVTIRSNPLYLMRIDKKVQVEAHQPKVAAPALITNGNLTENFNRYYGQSSSNEESFNGPINKFFEVKNAILLSNKINFRKHSIKILIDLKSRRQT